MASQWLTRVVRRLLHPVTVAGPRRLLTGLPWPPAVMDGASIPAASVPALLRLAALRDAGDEARDEHQGEHEQPSADEQRGGVAADEVAEIDLREREHRDRQDKKQPGGGNRREADARHRLRGATPPRREPPAAGALRPAQLGKPQAGDCRQAPARSQQEAT